MKSKFTMYALVVTLLTSTISWGKFISSVGSGGRSSGSGSSWNSNTGYSGGSWGGGSSGGHK